MFTRDWRPFIEGNTRAAPRTSERKAAWAVQLKKQCLRRRAARMSGTLDRDRRRFFGTAAATLAAVELAAIGSAHAQSGELQGELRGGPPAKTSPRPLEQNAPRGPKCRHPP